MGYNLRRKIVLHAVWALSPVILWIQPTVFGLFPPITSTEEMIYQVGEIWLWVGIGALAFRTVHLFFLRDVQTGLVWITKIVTDPFQDIKTYWKAPLYLMRGELIDPMHGKGRALEEFQTHATPDSLVRELGRLHHQPSRCIAAAAATMRFAISANASSGRSMRKMSRPVPTQLNARPSARR